MSRLSELIEQLKHQSSLELTTEELLDALWFTIVTSESESELKPKQLPQKSTLSQSKSLSNIPSQPPPQKEEEKLESLPEPTFPAYVNTDKIETKIKSQGIFLDVKDPAAIPEFWEEEIKHILQTVRRKIPSNKTQEMDEEATVQFIAETELYEPIFKPNFKRSLSLSIVIELGTSVLIWYKVLEEIEEIFKQTQNFYQVDIWWMKVNNKQQVILQSSYEENTVTYAPKKIINNPPDEQLILIISDFCSVNWYENNYLNTLNEWSQKGLVTLLQLFPKRLWSRTALDRKNEVILQSPPMGGTNLPYILNQQLTIKELSSFNAQNSLKLPIITLEPYSLKQWANLVNGKKQTTLPGILIKNTNLSSLKSHQVIPSKIQQKPEQILSRFYENASEKAQELAHRLSAVPVTLPIIRLIIQSVSSFSSEKHQSIKREKTPFSKFKFDLSRSYKLPAITIAEVLMGGLFEPLDNPIKSISRDFLNLIELEFKPGIREALEKEATEDKLVDTITLISDYISQYLGDETDIFEAILLDPALKAELPESVRHFAEISLFTLHNLGGVYANYVEQYPIVEQEETDLPLQQWTFETPTVNSRGEIIKTTTHTASYFIEPLTDNVILTMVAIPGGTFTMGSPETEKDSYSDERPQHNVTLSPFFMGKYPITQAQWKAIASRTDLKINIDLDEDPSRFKHFKDSSEGMDRWLRPVERVNWYEAVEFCQRLSTLTGRDYRLPSEAQWEYACRAMTEPLNLENNEAYPPFYFGETITDQLANYDASKTYADEPKGKYRKETTQVGKFPPNAFGLYDMHGNVDEWCADDSHDNYEDAPTDGSPWLDGEESDDFTDKNLGYLTKNNDNNSKSVLRGGSWDYNPSYCRSAIQFISNRDDNRRLDLGFRVVCVFGS